MAISSKIEEIILELSKTAGNIYDALSLGLGDFNQPNSSIFEINNLLNLANNGYPFFGVVETNPLGFGLTYSLSSDPYYLTINGGQVAYDGSLLQTTTQKIPLRKEWSKDYSDTFVGSDGYKYGITIGLPLEEIPSKQNSISGGFFIIHRDKIDWWTKTYNSKLELYFKNNYLVKDDQIILADCILSNLNDFLLFIENINLDNWFMFQRILN